jgi:hypothetical protein
MNVAADFSALEAKGGNYVSIGHAPNLGADPIHFLWQLRHNTGKLRTEPALRDGVVEIERGRKANGNTGKTKVKEPEPNKLPLFSTSLKPIS